MHDPTLFAALNLNYPGLEIVKEAVIKKNYRIARIAMADYLRQRTNVTFPLPPVRNKGFNTAAADACVRREVTVCGITHRFPGSIDWTFNKTTEPGSPYATDHEWTWQLGRMNFWNDLGAAFAATGNETYARAFVEQMTGWVQQNTPPKDHGNHPGSRWRTIECGIRMAGSWPMAFFRFLKSPSFTDDAMICMLGSFLQHARHLKTYPQAGNWLTMEMNGLYHVGALFPEFRDADLWRDQAAGTLARDMDIQVYPDGAQNELSPGYHVVALSNFQRLADIALVNRLPLPDGYEAKLERMYQFTMMMATPGRSNPHFNDSWDIDLKKILKKGYSKFPHRKDFQWIATEGRKGTPPTAVSHAFPYAGYLMLRSSWKRHAHLLAFDAGTMGRSHSHEDKLSFELYSFGRRIIADCGSYAYDNSPMRRYVLSHHAHNTCYVDGMSQNRRPSKDIHVTTEELPFAWHTDANFDFAEASFGTILGEGYGTRGLTPATHTRAVFFAKPDMYIVVDVFKPNNCEKHTYEFPIHLDTPQPDHMYHDTRTHSITTLIPESPNLHIHPVSPHQLSCRIISGRKKPLQGWMPLKHGRTGARPIPVPQYRISAPGTVRTAYIMYPLKAGQSQPIQSTELIDTGYPDSLAFRIRFKNGRRAVFFHADTLQKKLELEGKTVKARVYYRAFKG